MQASVNCLSTCTMFKAILGLGLASAASMGALISGAATAEAKPAVMSETIRVSEVKAAQNAWCDALINISKTHAEGGLAKSKHLAGDVIDAAYGYQFGPVAFKPTEHEVLGASVCFVETCRRSVLHPAISPLAAGRILPIQDVTGASPDSDTEFLRSRDDVLFAPHEILFISGELRPLFPQA